MRPWLGVYVMCAIAAVGQSSENPVTALETSFEEGLDGWVLQLNRGARAETALDSAEGGLDRRCVRVDIERLSAPDDRAIATNVHLRRQPVRLQAGQRYLYRIWAKSAVPRRRITLRLNRISTAESVPGASRTFAADTHWQPFWFHVTADSDIADARLQIVIGDDDSTVWVDRVSFGPAPDELALKPGDVLWSDDVFGEPLRWRQDGDTLVLVNSLPPACRLMIDNVLPDAGGRVEYRLGAGETGVRLRFADGRLTGNRGNADAAESVALTVTPDGRLPVVIDRTADGLRVNQFGETVLELGFRTHPGPLTIAGIDPDRPPKLVGRELIANELHAPQTASNATFVDPETGVTIHRLTRSPTHTIHAYYDICPWSPDAEMIVFTSSLPGAGGADICIANADGSEPRVVASNGSFGMHTGAFTQWAADGRSVFYSGRTSEGSGLVRVALDTLEQTLIGNRSRMISPDGTRSLYLQRGKDGGLGIMGIDGSDPHLIARWPEVMALSPSQEEIRKKPPFLTNCKWSPDGGTILFGITNEHTRPRTVKELFTVKPDGSDLRWLCPYQHHHIWSRNSRQVLFNGREGMMIIDADGTNLRRLSWLSSGHPSFSPDGRWIVTDCYRRGDLLSESLALIEARTGEVRKLVNVPNRSGHTHETGVHTHPVWRPDGRQVLYNSDQDGLCQLYAVDLPAWETLPRVPEPAAD